MTTASPCSRQGIVFSSDPVRTRRGQFDRFAVTVGEGGDGSSSSSAGTRGRGDGVLTSAARDAVPNSDAKRCTTSRAWTKRSAKSSGATRVPAGERMGHASFIWRADPRQARPLSIYRRGPVIEAGRTRLIQNGETSTAAHRARAHPETELAAATNACWCVRLHPGHNLSSAGRSKPLLRARLPRGRTRCAYTRATRTSGAERRVARGLAKGPQSARARSYDRRVVITGATASTGFPPPTGRCSAAAARCSTRTAATIPARSPWRERWPVNSRRRSWLRP